MSILLSLFILIIVFSISFAIYSAKFRNPYKLYFIFGKKGSGKSCLMINRMLYYKKKGYIIYTDMNVTIPGVRIINPDDLKDHWPDKHCAIFIDEAQLYWDNRQFKSFAHGFLEFFSYQRKIKAILYMNSQSFDIDKKIRDRSDGLILQTNIGNVISVSRPILKTFTLTQATGDEPSSIAEQLVFDKVWHWKLYHMPSYFKYYDSFAVPDRPPLPYREVS